jgi:hypothetical protein
MQDAIQRLEDAEMQVDVKCSNELDSTESNTDMQRIQQIHSEKYDAEAVVMQQHWMMLV